MVSQRAKDVVDAAMKEWSARKHEEDTYEREPIHVKKDKNRGWWKGVADVPKDIFMELRNIEKRGKLTAKDLCIAGNKLQKNPIGKDVIKIISFIKSLMKILTLTDSERVQLYTIGLKVRHGNSLISPQLKNPHELTPEAFILLATIISSDKNLQSQSLLNSCFIEFNENLSADYVLGLLLAASRIRVFNFPLDKYLKVIKKEGLSNVDDTQFSRGLLALSKLFKTLRTPVDAAVIQCFTEKLALTWVKPQQNVLQSLEGLVKCNAPVKGILQYALPMFDMSDATPTDYVAVIESYVKGKYLSDLLWKQVDITNIPLSGFSQKQICMLANAFGEASYQDGISYLESGITTGVITQPDCIASIAMAQILNGVSVGTAAITSLDFPAMSGRLLAHLITTSHRSRYFPVLRRAETHLLREFPKNLSSFNEVDLRAIAPAYKHSPLYAMIKKIVRCKRG